MSVVRTLPAGLAAAGLVAVGNGTALATALSVVSLLAMLLLLRSMRFQLRESLTHSGRHRRADS